MFDGLARQLCHVGELREVAVPAGRPSAVNYQQILQRPEPAEGLS
jgi:hypothetical protein